MGKLDSLSEAEVRIKTFDNTRAEAIAQGYHRESLLYDLCRSNLEYWALMAMMKLVLRTGDFSNFPVIGTGSKP